MNATQDRIRALIAQEAADWFLANREGADAAARNEFALWLKASPMHVEEYLAIALIARDLPDACADPQLSVDALIARARAAGEANVAAVGTPVAPVPRRNMPRRWLPAAAAAAVVAALGLGFLLWNVEHGASPPARMGPLVSGITGIPFTTRHGEQLSQKLADGSVLHLNTDTAVKVYYDRTRRLVELDRGQVVFDVAHEADRAFLVIAGAAEVVAVGTTFDVYRKAKGSTVVTVLDGRVKVIPLEALGSRNLASSGETPPRHYGAGPAIAQVEVAAGQRTEVDAGEPIPPPSAVDTERASAWLRGQIVFEHEPLELAAAEFNRYARTPIEIDTPALRSLQVSGSFAAADTESFIAYLRNLKGVRVQVTPAHIRVSRN